MKVVMIGADRSVKGGVSAVVNNLYRAGLDQKVDLTYIGTMVDGSKARKALQAALALLRFVWVMPGCDIVHVNMAADASCRRKMIFMKVARLFGKKVIIHEHGGDFQGFYYERCSEKQRQKVKKALNAAELFLVLSDNWKEFFANIVDPAKIRVLQNGVLVPEQSKKDYSSHSVVFLGRLCKEKGIGELLEAVPAIRQQIPDFQLVLGGFWEAGNEELRKRAEQLSDIVSCPGWIDEKEKEQLFTECSMFVLPTWFEGQPISLLEAMAAGMCVAASAVGGIPQILAADGGSQNGRGSSSSQSDTGSASRSESGMRSDTVQVGRTPDGPGILLEPKDPEKLTETLVQALQDEGLRAKLGQRARNRILQEYDINRSVERLVGFYEEI